MSTKNNLQDSLEKLVTNFVKSHESSPSFKLIEKIAKKLDLYPNDLLPNPHASIFTAEHVFCDELIGDFLRKAKTDYNNSHIFGVGHSFSKKALVTMRIGSDIILAPIAAVVGGAGMGVEKLGMFLGANSSKSWTIFNASGKIINAIGWSTRCVFLKNQNETGLAENIYNKYRPISACIDKLVNLNPHIMEKENSPRIEEKVQNEQYTHNLEKKRSFTNMVIEQSAIQKNESSRSNR